MTGKTSHSPVVDLTPIAENISPRLLYSADVAALTADVSLPGWADPVYESVSETVAPESSINAQSEQHANVQSTLVVLDERTPNLDYLVADLSQQHEAGSNIQWLVLSAEEDGLTQLTQALATANEPFDSVQIVTHGSAGRFQLGDKLVDADLINDRGAEFESWANSLSEHADILIFGCELTRSAEGLTLIESLAALTQADVAASDDVTGHASLQGDWHLEALIGDIESDIALSALAIEQWLGVLDLSTSGSDTLVTESSVGSQTLPLNSSANQIASNGSANVVVWEEGDQIHFRQFDTNGNATGGSQTIEAGNAFDRHTPAVAINASGQFVIAWVSDGQDGSGDGIYAQRFAADGTPLARPSAALSDANYGNAFEFRVNSFTTNDQQTPSVAMYDDGRFVIGYSGKSNASADSSFDAFLRFYGSDGNPTILQDARASQDTAAGQDQENVVVAVNNTNGKLYIAYSYDDGSTERVYVARIEPTAPAIEFQGLFIMPDSSRIAPAIDVNDQGLVAIVYGVGTSPTTEDVNLAILDADLNLVAGPTSVAQDSASRQRYASVSVGDDNAVLAVWQSQVSDNQYDIYAREFNGTGTPVSGDVLVNSFTNQRQHNPGVVIHGAQASVIWAGRSAADNDDLSLRLLNLNSPEIIATEPIVAQTSEDGSEVSYGFSLASEPVGTVTIDIAVSDPSEASISAAQLFFDAANWNQTQTLVVTGLDDAIVDGDQSYSLTLDSSGSADAAYAALSPRVFGLINRDTTAVINTPLLTVTDTNLTPNEINENSTRGTPVGLTLQSLDIDPGDTVLYSLDDDAGGRFQIDPASGIVTAGPTITDFESQQQHSIVIRASSSDTSSVTVNEFIQVNDVAEAPSAQASAVTGVQDNIYTFLVEDFGSLDDDSGDSLQAVRIDSLPAAGLLSVGGTAITPGNLVSAAQIMAGDLIFTPDVGTFGNPYAQFLFSAEDQTGLLSPVPATLRVDISQVLGRPVITSDGGGSFAAINVISGNASVTQVQASDSDSTALSYSLVSDTDTALFSIDPTSGNLSFNTAPDYTNPQDADLDNRYELTVQARDESGNLDEQRLLVTVLSNELSIRGPGMINGVEDTQTTVFSAASITDALNAATLQVSLSVGSGDLSLGSVAGLNFAQGDGDRDATMRFSGPPADVATAIDTLIYSPAPDQNGQVNGSISVADPTAPTRTDVDAFSINVNAVNDAPVLSLVDAIELTPNSAQALTSQMISASDIDADEGTLVFTLASAPAGSELRLNGVALSAGDTFNQTQINEGRLALVAGSSAADSGPFQIFVSDTAGQQSARLNLSLTILTGNPVTQPPVESPPAEESASVELIDAENEVDSDTPTSADDAAASQDRADAPANNDSAGSGRSTGNSVEPGISSLTPPSFSTNQETRERLLARDSRAFLPNTAPLRELGLDQSQAQSNRGLTANTEFDRERSLRITQQSFMAADFQQSLASLENEVLANSRLEHRVVASSVVVSSGVSIGYVIWLLRSGAFISSVLASVPAWRSIDPLPVLSSLGQARDDATEDDESLEKLVNQSGNKNQFDPQGPDTLSGTPAKTNG